MVLQPPISKASPGRKVPLSLSPFFASWLFESSEHDSPHVCFLLIVDVVVVVVPPVIAFVGFPPPSLPLFPMHTACVSYPFTAALVFGQELDFFSPKDSRFRELVCHFLSARSAYSFPPWFSRQGFSCGNKAGRISLFFWCVAWSERFREAMLQLFCLISGSQKPSPPGWSSDLPFSS